MEHEKVCIITQKEVLYTQYTSYNKKMYKTTRLKFVKKIRKNKLRTFEAGNFKTKNWKKMINISFKNVLTKEWLEHRQAHLLSCNEMFHSAIKLHTPQEYY